MACDYTLAKMADASYNRHHDNLPPVVFRGFDGAEYAEIRDDGIRLYLAIRGTDELKDWRRNLNARYGEPAWQHEGDGSVHRGFMRAAQSFGPHILHALQGIPRRYITLLGHSGAGPVACLIAEWLEDKGCNVERVVTFACPNWCDEDYAEHYDIPTINYAAGRWPLFRDPIPHYPHWMTKPGDTRRLPGHFGPLHNHGMQHYLHAMEQKQ